jgi:iron complex outermembrane receptor protein
MTFRKRLLASSAGIVAIIGFAAPAVAATDTDASSGSTTSEVVVTGIKESLQRAIAIKRENSDQVDAVSAEDIGKLPDKNVADALQRIPGINTESAASGEGGFDENDRVSIRGTSPSLTQVTVDGHTIATGDWFILDQYSAVGRSVSLDLLPAEMLSSTTVYKTQDASLMEGGVSGVVNLSTPNALDLGGASKQWVLEATAEGAYNSLRGSWKPQVNGEIGWKNADDTFGVAVQGFYEDRSVARYGQETLGYTTITSAMPIGAANPSLATAGVQAPTLIGSTLFQQERTREGGHIDVEWRPNDKLELNLDGFYSHMSASNSNDNYMYWGANELKNNLPSSFKVVNNTLVSATWPTVVPITAYTPAPSPTCVGVCTGGTAQDGIIVDNIERPGSAAYTSYVNLDGKYHATDRLTISGQIGYTVGEGDTDGAPSFEVDAPVGVAYQPSGNGWQVTPTGLNPQSPAGLSDDWSWNEDFISKDSEIYGQVDAKYDLDNGVFKDVEAGFHAQQHTRQVDGWDRGCTLGANGACYGSPTMPFSATNPTPYPSGFSASALGIPGLLIPIAGNPTTIGNILNAIPGGVRGPLSAIVQPLNYYWNLSFKVQENDYSGYLMSHVEGDGWRGNFGVRLVETDEQSFVNTASTCPVAPAVAPPGTICSSAYGGYIVNDIKHNYFDVLPSANFTFDIQKNLLLRFSAAETMSRPDYSALGAAVSLTDLTFTGNGGNPNLRPITAGVYDAALEWYYAPTAVATVSLFYDDLSSYVGYGNSVGKYLDLQTSTIGVPGKTNVYDYENFTVSSPINVSGELKGVELQLQQPLPYNFGIQSNFTYVDGEDQNGDALVGTSKVTYNVVAYYEVPLFDVRLAYTYRSHYFVGLDRASPEVEAGNGQLDASADLNITKNVTFEVQALNITDSLLKYYAANPTQVRAVYENGTQVYAGVHVKF